MPCVIVTDESLDLNVPFKFDAESCSVRQLVDAIASKYGLKVWEDAHRNVMWLIPLSVQPETLFATELEVPFTQMGLLLHDSVLKILPALDPSIKDMKAGGQNTYNRPVSIESGLYSIRDLISCLVHSVPSMTYYIEISSDGREKRLRPISLISHETRPNGFGHYAPANRPGLELLWKTFVKSTDVCPPTIEQIGAAFSDPDAIVRHYARLYVCSGIDWVGLVGYPSTSSPRKAWFAIQMSLIAGGLRYASLQPEIETARELLADQSLGSKDPCLTLMLSYVIIRGTESRFVNTDAQLKAAAFEVNSGNDLSGEGTKNLEAIVEMRAKISIEEDSLLQVAVQSELPCALSQIPPEAYYMARLSKGVRDDFKKRAANEHNEKSGDFLPHDSLEGFVIKPVPGKS